MSAAENESQYVLTKFGVILQDLRRRWRTFKAGGETYTAAVSPSAALGYQSIRDIHIGLAGRRVLNRFGRLELLVETTRGLFLATD